MAIYLIKFVIQAICLNDIESASFNNGLFIQILELQLKDGSKKEIGISLDEYKRMSNKLNNIKR
ncbi:MAG: hypothetical protein RR623_08225 [Bacilli bacterium]